MKFNNQNMHFDLYRFKFENIICYPMNNNTNPIEF